MFGLFPPRPIFAECTTAPEQLTPVNHYSNRSLCLPSYPFEVVKEGGSQYELDRERMTGLCCPPTR